MAERLESFGEIESAVWTALERAAGDPHHEWRTPVLATLDADGQADARTVVLRHVQPDNRMLVFFSDSRSPKVAELLAAPSAALVFWSKRLNWQLRLQVVTRVHTEGPLVDAAWARVSQSPAAGDYLSPNAPGSALTASPDGETGAHHLTVVTAQIDHIDWLELARAGHRRARITQHSLSWLVP